jgi:hypothetical protein
MGSLAGPMPCDYSNLPTISDDVFLRFSTWARWHLGIPLPVD